MKKKAKKETVLENYRAALADQVAQINKLNCQIEEMERNRNELIAYIKQLERKK